MEQTEGAPPPPPPPPLPLPAEHDTDCGEEADDAPETKEELTKDGDESLHKNQGGQTSISEKQMTADEKCSKGGVQDELLRQEASGWPRRPPSTFPSQVYGSASGHVAHGLLSPSLKQFVLGSRPSKKSKGQVNILPAPRPSTSNWNNVPSTLPELACAGYSPSPYIPSSSSSFDSSDELILGESKKTYPSTAADATPGHSQDDTRRTELYETAGPSTFQPSTKEDKDSDSAACYDREKGVELSGSTLNVLDKLPRQEVSNVFSRSASTCSFPVYGSSSVIRRAGLPSPLLKHLKSLKECFRSRPSKKSKGQVNILPAPRPSTSNWNNVPSTLPELACAGYSPSPYIPSSSSSFDSSDELILGESKKTYPTAADATPGHSQDDTRRTELHATAGPSTFQPSTKEDKDSDSASFYDREKGVELFGNTVDVYDKPPTTIMNSTPHVEPWTKSSAQDLKVSISGEKQKEQATHNVLPQPGLLYEGLVGAHRPLHGLQSYDNPPPSYQSILKSAFHFPRSSYASTAGAYARPGHSQDDTRATASPGKPLLGTSGSGYFLPGSSSTQLHSDPQKPECSAKGQMFPPATAGNFSTENPHLKQHSPLSRSNHTSSLSQVPSAKNSTLTQAEYVSNMSLDLSTKHPTAATESCDYTLARPSPGPLRETVIKTLYTAADATPSQIQDDTRGTANPRKLLLGTSGRGYLMSGSSSTQIHSDPQKPDGRAREEMFPPVTVWNDTQVQRYSLLSCSYNTSSMSESYCDTSKRSKIKSAVKHKRKSKIQISRRKKKSKKSSPGVASTVDSSDCTLARPSPGPLRETVIKTLSTASDPTPGNSQDNTRRTELYAAAGPFLFEKYNWWSPYVYTAESAENRSEIMSVQSESASGPESDAQMDMETSLTDVKSSATNTLSTVSAVQSSLQLPDFQVQSEFSDLDLEFQYNYQNRNFSTTVETAGSGENINDKPQPSECEAGGDDDVLVKMEAPVTAVSSSVTNTQLTRPHLQLSSDPGWSQRGSSCLPRSHSVPSLSQISCAENKTFRPSQSLPDMLLKSSFFEGFTPDITVDDNDESYRFLCSCPGLYQCSVTGLVFHMEGEGDVVYRIVSWDRRLLAQHHKKPAGPLFDIKCLQQSVCRLHLPHCEIPSTAGCPFLSVAHLNDEGIEFIPPHKITDTHVIINISGFSAFGNVKDEDSPPEPVRALVLLFYRPLSDQNLTSFLNVLMLPRNVVVRDVRRTRKKLVGDELYIETSSHCKLLPKQEYTLSTCPEDDSVLVQPKDAEFDEESYDNYIPSFQVTLKTIMLNMKVLLRDTNSSHIVWQREVCLPSAGLKRPCVQGSSVQILKDIRSSFIEGISGPVLKSLLDKLFEKKVLTDSERESADDKHNREDKARFVIDTVRRKGEAASLEVIEFLREVDPFLCKHLGLIVT